MPKSAEHVQHIASRISHNDCGECRADCERRHVRGQWPGYEHVHDYLSHIRPRLSALKAGESSWQARNWYREFHRALDLRISLKVDPPKGRKYCDSYLDRLRNATGGRNATMSYLRKFAARRASTL